MPIVQNAYFYIISEWTWTKIYFDINYHRHLRHFNMACILIGANLKLNQFFLSCSQNDYSLYIICRRLEYASRDSAQN